MGILRGGVDARADRLSIQALALRSVRAPKARSTAANELQPQAGAPGLKLPFPRFPRLPPGGRPVAKSRLLQALEDAATDLGPRLSLSDALRFARIQLTQPLRLPFRVGAFDAVDELSCERKALLFREFESLGSNRSDGASHDSQERQPVINTRWQRLRTAGIEGQSPWQSSAGTSHPRLGRTVEDQQGEDSGGYVAPGALPSSAQDPLGHPEPGSLLTEFVDGFEGPPRAETALLSVRATAKHLGVSLATVYSLVATRQLHCVRISNAIRIHPRDLAAYLALRRE
jgi:hypothetical protein